MRYSYEALFTRVMSSIIKFYGVVYNKVYDYNIYRDDVRIGTVYSDVDNCLMSTL